jgi:predicted RND superfamily exporter protein
MIGSARFWERALGALTAAAVRRPRATVAWALALAAAASLLAAARLELRTSNLDLIDPALPEVARFRALAAEFGTPNLLVVVLEGDDGNALERAVTRVATSLDGVAGVRSVLARLPFQDDFLVPFGTDPYFRSRDGGMAFVFVQPDDPDSAAATIAPFVDGVRRAIAGLGLPGDGIRVGFTGLPQYALDDRDFVQRDLAERSGFAFVAILALFAVAFRGLREPALAMATLAISAAVTAGVAAIVPGHLTLVSAFFVSILFGLGIDFGVHLLERAAEEREAGADPAASFVAAARFLAAGLGTGAATTIASFLLLIASGLRGFAELGWLAGVGVGLALVAMLTLLPALAILIPSRAGARHRPRRAGRIVLALQRPALAWLLVAAAATVFVAGVPRFDGDYLALQPRDSQAVRLERAMVERSDYATQFAVFVTPDPTAAARLVERLRDEPTVAAVRSAADFDALLALGAEIPGAWERFRAFYRAPDGREAVYAFPDGDLWDDAFQQRFLARMRALDPQATGMPFLGRFLVERSRRALRVTATLAALLLVLLVGLDFTNPWRAVLALTPTVIGVAGMLAAMRGLGLDFNPLNALALPIVLGVAEDSGVHLVHRFVAERGDLARTLSGAGRTIVLCGATTLIGFGSLIGASHRGLASFATALTIGTGAALAASLLVLPVLLVACRRRLLASAGGAQVARA